MGGLQIQVDGQFWDHREVGVFNLQAARFERFTHRFEASRFGLHFDHVVIDLDVVGARVDRGEGRLVAVLAAEWDGDQALGFELPAHRAGFAKVAARTAEAVAHLGDGAITVVRQRLDDDRGAARAVTFVLDLVELFTVARGAAALGDCTFDVVVRHVDGAGALDGEAELEVRVEIAAALGRDDDLSRELGEDCTALRVGRALGALDG